MSEPTVDNTFNVKTDLATGTMQITLLQNGRELGSVTIDTRKSAALAGIILGSAQAIFQASGRPPPYSSKEQEVELTAVTPSGYNVGPGRKPGLLMLHFYFGETTLGIEVPNSLARILGQRLMTSAAEGTPQ